MKSRSHLVNPQKNIAYVGANKKAGADLLSCNILRFGRQNH